MDNKKLWDSVLVEMELSLSKPNFNTWFKDTYICKQEEGSVFVSVPNAFVEEWLSTKFHNSILKALRSLSSSISSLQYIISKEKVSTKIQTPNQDKSIPPKKSTKSLLHEE